jgi:hypothetical protein
MGQVLKPRLDAKKKKNLLPNPQAPSRVFSYHLSPGTPLTLEFCIGGGCLALVPREQNMHEE